MKVSSRIQNPESVEMTLTLTMTVGRWLQLKGQLEAAAWPATELRCAISEAAGNVVNCVFNGPEVKE